MSLLKKNVFLAFINGLIIDHPTPSNISYLWNFGSLAALALVIQIISGIFLAMHYVPSIDYAFFSVEHIMRDINFGWFMRYLHANGAAFFFFFIYFHIFRGIYYNSFKGENKETWLIGVTIYFLMMASAFLGYVLPWGQMSLWAATVITNFFSIILFIGNDVVTWLWGGYSVNYATLNRFFSLHFFIPFLIVALVFLHLIALHEAGHTNPLGINSTSLFNRTSNFDGIENISFFPYFIVKDLFGIVCAFIFLLFFVIYLPNYFGHSDNYIQANPLLTPPHIVPEWYFLPFYTILRSIPNKAFGVCLMFLSIMSLYFLPLLSFSTKSSLFFQPLFRIIFWFFVVNCFILGWIGGNPVEYPYYSIGQFATFSFFSFFFFFVPLITYIEKSANEN
jgi:quinol-cytochrome oxidoreductase complex cytochrome b subunit